MRILLITPFVPHRRAGHGTATVASRFVEFFAPRHHLSICTFRFSGADLELAEEIRRGVEELRCVPFPGTSWLGRQRTRLRSVVGRRPFLVELFDVPEMRAAVRSMTASTAFDLVQMDTVFMGQYLDELPRGGSKRVLVEIDVAMKPLERSYRRSRVPGVRALLRREWKRMERYEPRLCREFDLVYAVSEEDRALLEGSNPPVRASLLRYGVDPEVFGYGTGRSAGKNLLFLGSFMHGPNRDAVQWFHRSILPRVRKRHPDAKVFYVGTGPTPPIERLAREEGVTVTGWVPDLRRYLESADVGVVPLRLGGGVKLKTLELMAAGKAVVTTPIGGEGIAAQDGIHWLVAGSAISFADRVVELLDDPEKRAALGTRARELTRRDHYWPENLARVESELLDLVREHRVEANLSGSRPRRDGRNAVGAPRSRIEHERVVR